MNRNYEIPLAWTEIARQNVDKHLASVLEECQTTQDLFEEALRLAADALADTSCPDDLRGNIAQQVAALYAQP